MNPLARTTERVLAGEAIVGGVSSGTSADAIDVALFRPRPFREGREGREGRDEGRGSARAALGGVAEVLAFRSLPFPRGLGQRLRALLDREVAGEEGRVDVRSIALLSRDLGRAFGAALRAVAEDAGLALDLAGSHGQTVWHHDGHEPSGPATLQLGDGDFVAEEAGCPVVSDFRQRDVAVGGEGAPLIALVDPLLFPALELPAAVLNLGGIANLTLLLDDAPDRFGGWGPIAFDVGPAGTLLDGLARMLRGVALDEDGALAAAGEPREELVAELLGHPFFGKRPPKSTGRDTFGRAWVEDVVTRAAELEPPLRAAPDLLATGVRLVARSVGRALAELAPPGLRALVVAGGGVHNRTLMAALAEDVGPLLAGGAGAVVSSADLGVDPDAREALGFGLLAAAFATGRPLPLPSATGAREVRILGKLSLGPPERA